MSEIETAKYHSLGSEKIDCKDTMKTSSLLVHVGIVDCGNNVLSLKLIEYTYLSS